MTAFWIAFKAFAGPFLEGLWRVLTDWRVVVAFITAVTLWFVHEDGRDAGRNEAKIEQQSAVIAAQSDRLAANDKTFERLEKDLAAIRDAGLKRAAEDKARADALEKFRKEILNAPDPRCVLTDRDVQLLDPLGGFAAPERSGPTSQRVPPH